MFIQPQELPDYPWGQWSLPCCSGDGLLQAGVTFLKSSLETHISHLLCHGSCGSLCVTQGGRNIAGCHCLLVKIIIGEIQALINNHHLTKAEPLMIRKVIDYAVNTAESSFEGQRDEDLDAVRCPTKQVKSRTVLRRGQRLGQCRKDYNCQALDERKCARSQSYAGLHHQNNRI